MADWLHLMTGKGRRATKKAYAFYGLLKCHDTTLSLGMKPMTQCGQCQYFETCKTVKTVYTGTEYCQYTPGRFKPWPTVM